jgi:hypothetical protein
MARSGLARAQLQWVIQPRRWLRRPPGNNRHTPHQRADRSAEGLALLGLHRHGQSAQAFRDALTAADALLTLADSNVAALQARALALAGSPPRPATRPGPHRR